MAEQVHPGERFGQVTISPPTSSHHPRVSRGVRHIRGGPTFGLVMMGVWL